MSIRAATGIATLLLITSTLARAETLRLGSDVWPPFTDLPDKPRVAIELVQTALERVGIDSNSVVRSDFADVIQQIRDGQLDGSAAVWRSPEREKFLLYSRPYLENRLVLVGRKGSDTSAESLAALKGKRVAIVASYAYGDAVGSNTGPVFVKGSSDGDNLHSLLRGDVDYVLVDDLVVVHLFRRSPEKATSLLQVGTTPLLTRSLHFGLRRDVPHAAEIVKKFNDEIGKMIADGSYNRVLRLDWIRADVDGDGKSELVLNGAAAGITPPKSSYELFTLDEPTPKAGLKPRFLVNGHRYEDWDQVPPEYKIPLKNRPDPARPGIVLFEF
jgi:polar amino acid transport system substrate-binding protein